MSAANPNPMEKSMVPVLVVANAGGGSSLLCGVFRAWKAFPEALGRGARSWRCFGGISRRGVSEIT
jgi:hypothetical protein